jgi:hypothetical protein
MAPTPTRVPPAIRASLATRCMSSRS